MNTHLLQTGIYTVPEASRLTRVTSSRIRRWVRGYDFKVKHGRHRSPAVWNTQLEQIDETVALGFLDLLEMRCVDAFVTAGVGWKTLRRVHEQAVQLVGHSHPFCTNQFATDGETIFLKERDESGDGAIWDMRDLQRVFAQIIRPFLKDIEFDGDNIPQRWWPRGKGQKVALDPRRSFGQPILFEEGVPTHTLMRSVVANGSPEVVARWFEISPSLVRKAVEFERSLVE
jgi:uncharacterized protein (DUF433 family)